MSTVQRLEQQERLRKLKDNDFELSAIRTKIELMQLVNSRTEVEPSPYDSILGNSMSSQYR